MAYAEKNKVPRSKDIHNFFNIQYPKKEGRTRGPDFPQPICVRDHAEMAQRLTDIFVSLHAKYDVVVVVGHAIDEDLDILFRCCNWSLPAYATGARLNIVDTQNLGSGGLLLKTVRHAYPSLAALTRAVDVPLANAHNAACDALTMSGCLMQQGRMLDGTLTPTAFPFASENDSSSASTNNASSQAMIPSFPADNASSQAITLALPIKPSFEVSVDGGQVQAPQVKQKSRGSNKKSTTRSNLKRQRDNDESDDAISDSNPSKRHQPNKTNHPKTPGGFKLDVSQFRGGNCARLPTVAADS